MKKFSWEVKNAAGYHTGSVTPSINGRAPLFLHSFDIIIRSSLLKSIETFVTQNSRKLVSLRQTTIERQDRCGPKKWQNCFEEESVIIWRRFIFILLRSLSLVLMVWLSKCQVIFISVTEKLETREEEKEEVKKTFWLICVMPLISDQSWCKIIKFWVTFLWVVPLSTARIDFVNLHDKQANKCGTYLYRSDPTVAILIAKWSKPYDFFICTLR